MDIFAEYKRVFSCKRLNIDEETQFEMLSSIEIFGILIDPPVSTMPMRDETDRMFYDTAKASGATKGTPIPEATAVFYAFRLTLYIHAIYNVINIKRGVDMAQATLSIRVDEDVKKDAEILSAKLGLTLSAVTNVFYRQFVRTQGLPFPVTAVEAPKYKHIPLKERLKDFKGEYEFEEWDTGVAVGREIIE
ncbi:MAG: type II toxin-antitoxin system RelB/DinJ family antitoxin [Clostridiales bacterium]|jgi:DNA-damage-inducible protein J|nr:type II toxin-antitoxin system RelB/DinJ family antitoxin [Clostridiales bacterium]